MAALARGPRARRCQHAFPGRPPQTASVLELVIDTPKCTTHAGCQIELSADGQTWKTIYDASRRPGDGGQYPFPPQTVAAVRVSKLVLAAGQPAQVKTLRLGHAPDRFPSEQAGPTAVTTGRDTHGAWLKSRSGALTLRRLLSGDGALRLDYEYALTGSFLYHGITFDHDESAMTSPRWLGEGPSRVRQNRLHGTWLGLHENTRHVLQPGASFRYPEFVGCYAGVRWAQLGTKAGRLTIVSGEPATYLRIGTPRISQANTTVGFPPGIFPFSTPFLRWAQS